MNRAIPKHIIHKLERIHRYQHETKRLVDEVERWAGITDKSDDDLWTWGMHIDTQGDIFTPIQSLRMLIDFMSTDTDSEVFQDD